MKQTVNCILGAVLGVSFFILLDYFGFQKDHEIHVVATGDIHGAWFDESYDGGDVRPSLFSVKRAVDDLRAEEGEENVLLLDVGDCLQGDQAAYYYNYVATGEPHLFPLMAAYMGYDAIVVGNHDIETAHPVYDRVRRQLDSLGIPWLAANAVTPDGGTYFPEYTVVRKAGLKVLVVGFTNAEIKSWVSEESWSGMRFESISAIARERIGALRRKLHPQITVVVLHSGTGDGDARSLENEGLDVFESMKEVDLVVCGHDHTPFVRKDGHRCIVDAGAKAGMIGQAVVKVRTNFGRVVRVDVDASTTKLDPGCTDSTMKSFFRPQFEAVKSFTLKHVGELAMPLMTRESYTGPCDYMNLIHTVQMSVPEARLSIAAPLTFDGAIPAGELLYKDMFTIYPYENQMLVLNMRGSEIKNYLEASYGMWIQTPGKHVLRLQQRPDESTGELEWSFEGWPFNFDSCAGLNYSVDVSKAPGERVTITSLADGSPFDPSSLYPVAVNSYRANGGGGLMASAGLSGDLLESRVIARYPEIRDMVYRFILEHGIIDRQLVSDKKKLGDWKFVPEQMVMPLIEEDMDLIF